MSSIFPSDDLLLDSIPDDADESLFDFHDEIAPLEEARMAAMQRSLDSVQRANMPSPLFKAIRGTRVFLFNLLHREQ